VAEIERDLARCTRHHPCEHDLAQLGEEGHADACGAIRQQQSDRQHQQAWLDVELVDDPLEHDRDDQVEQLGSDDQAEREQDAADVGSQIGQQRGDDGKVVACGGGAGNGRGAGLVLGRVCGNRLRVGYRHPGFDRPWPVSLTCALRAVNADGRVTAFCLCFRRV
jgi:hypothetical protein